VIIKDLFYCFASTIGISSFLVTDILLLRSLYLTSSILFIISGFIYNITIIAIMNLFYLAVNSVQITRLLLERTAILLPEEFKPIYNKIFPSMKPKEFLAFVKIGKNKTSKQGEFLCYEGDTKDRLLLIINGRVSVEKNNKTIAELTHHFFVGEMRFLTQQPMSADVRAKSAVVRYLEWDYEQLMQLQKKKPDIYMKILTILGRDLVYKLQNQIQINFT